MARPGSFRHGRRAPHSAPDRPRRGGIPVGRRECRRAQAGGHGFEPARQPVEGADHDGDRRRIGGPARARTGGGGARPTVSGRWIVVLAGKGARTASGAGKTVRRWRCGAPALAPSSPPPGWRRAALWPSAFAEMDGRPSTLPPRTAPAAAGGRPPGSPRLPVLVAGRTLCRGGRRRRQRPAHLSRTHRRWCARAAHRAGRLQWLGPATERRFFRRPNGRRGKIPVRPPSRQVPGEVTGIQRGRP